MLAKANQALATLDKYRTRLDQVSTRLTALEFEGGATLHDVLTVLQRAELVTRMARRDRALHRRARHRGPPDRDAARGDDGRRRRRQGRARARLPRRATPTSASPTALDQLARLPHQDLLDFGRLAELLGYDRKVNTLDYPGLAPRLPDPRPHPAPAQARGAEHRRASSAGWTRSSPPRDAELETVEGVGEIRAKDIREGLRRLQEINLVDRYLQT